MEGDQELNVAPSSPLSRHRDQSMPLLVGLMESASRRSIDGSLPLHQSNGNGFSDGGEVDLEELAAKRVAGGGMIDSVANMANSILGAGNPIFRRSLGL